jgi:hypothetical protein
VDPQTVVIIQDLLREQIDEEAQSLTIVNRLKLAETGSPIIIGPRIREKGKWSRGTCSWLKH